jgi:hypothetical protein
MKVDGQPQRRQQVGTNFYTSDGQHIGKRSAAGVYCERCKQTLCKDGPQGIHKGQSAWHKACPSCDTPSDELPTASSFTWAMVPAELIGKTVMVQDEYGAYSTLINFGEMVRATQFHWYDSIGREFS